MKRPRRARPEAPAVDLGLAELAANRVAIEAVSPEIDAGRFPAKAVAGHPFVVEADIFCDGHDSIAAALLIRRADTTGWREIPMSPIHNDRWRGTTVVEDNARYVYTVIAWRDLFESWREEVTKKHAAGVDIALELTEARNLLVHTRDAGDRGSAADREGLEALIASIDATDGKAGRLDILLSAEAAELMRRVAIRTNLSRHERELPLTVDREAAAFSAWYELFPRSMSDDPGRHGTFDDVVAKLAYVRDMGFDVLYFPPIHPIGTAFRKGKNNTLEPGPDDPGSPYAIGSPDGGHEAIHPELGSFEDFTRLIAAARDHGLEIALDFAIQCSPDHPWIRQHPEWFDWRPDGTIKYAENPPKKYQDIVNVHFYREAFPAVWYALRDIVLFWAGHGVRIFRVDNPHTKPFPFWEWMIADVQAKHPDVIFLAEAFTRPKVMKRLAKIGFTQSYSYFTWRNTKAELTDYLTELTRTECRHYMRPNFFVNTPDINPVYLQTSGRPGFRVRAVLAAALGGSYGVYSGFELCEGTPIPGREEYLDSEKYEIRAWDWDRPGNIRADIALLNRLRRESPAMRDFTNLAFHNAWNDNILYFARSTPAKDDFLLFAVNLDPHNGQGADFEIPLWEFGLPDEAAIDARNLVTGEDFVWHGKTQHMWLDPDAFPYLIWRLLPFDGARA
ncbi:alpha-1,4-glucan--maltose-1-phosphate maltosyltransferase [Bauldia sp.]|uniref:alpha-1,4-glucan--maltose-1-phosphate maltosyltransferase n=1 Tax=Bauldia sp. TaxID=2575872 RepID=UPI0025C4738F|nr:alpha-1,4-glucan--maltose-1-phosphate maltosyltransferase [Bauldia sp.]